MSSDKKSSDILRRRILKGTVTGAGVGALALFSAGSQSAYAAGQDKKPKESVYDAVIIGQGCAGMVCAIHAAELGLKPVIIEKMTRAAGNTMYAGGHFLAVNSRFQKEQGINNEDSADKFYEDMIIMSQGKGDPKLTRFFVENSASSLEWLTDSVGIQWKKLEMEAYPALGRGHVVSGPSKPGGSQLIKQLTEKVEALKIPVLNNTKALELVTDEMMHVNGVKVIGPNGFEVIKGRAGVVLATGGFHAAAEMVTAFMGGWAAQMPIRGSRIITGENIKLASQVCAKMVNIDQFHAGPIYGSANPSIMVNYGALVTKDGTRYIDEVNTYVRVAKETPRLTKDNLAFIIVEESIKNDSNMVKERFDRYERNKAPIYRADTLEGLAKEAGINPDALVKTIKEYNDAIKNKTTDKLNPPLTLENPRLIEKGPFCAFPFQGGMTATFGGPLVNVNTEVINNENRPIKGLYAIGNSIGGLFYDDYIVGSQLTAATIYGLVCAKELKKKLA